MNRSLSTLWMSLTLALVPLTAWAQPAPEPPPADEPEPGGEPPADGEGGAPPADPEPAEPSDEPAEVAPAERADEPAAPTDPGAEPAPGEPEASAAAAAPAPPAAAEGTAAAAAAVAEPSSDREDWLRLDTPSGVWIRPNLQVFAQYALELRDGADDSLDWYHEFELERAHLGVAMGYEEGLGRVLVEAVRSASEGALIGVGGDSLVMRLREAYGGYTLFEMLSLKAGVVPTLTIGRLEGAAAMRPIVRTGTEAAGLTSPADLGATAALTIPAGYGWVAAGGFNGEGYTSRELNRGKNFEVSAEVHPFAFFEPVEPLALFGSYAGGSTGTGLAKANRVTAALMWTEGIIRGYAGIVYAMGVDGVGDQDALLVDTQLRAEPLDGLLLGAQVMHWLRDVDLDEDVLTSITGSLGYRFIDPMALHLALDKMVLGSDAEAALPGLYSWRFRAVADVTF